MKNTTFYAIILKKYGGEKMLYFDDVGDEHELNIMYEALNALKILFHPVYAPEGELQAESIFELQNKNVVVFIDSNILSPIYEASKTGSSTSPELLQKASLVITWANSIRARLNCGICLAENDHLHSNQISGEEKRRYFLYGLGEIHEILWKNLAFGYIKSIPDGFLKNIQYNPDESFDCSLSEEYLTNEAAMIKLVKLLRKQKTGIDAYIEFVEWYADHLIVADSILVYAAMVFSNMEHISKPKKYASKDINAVKNGIKNQAWDLTYITEWSHKYYPEFMGKDTENVTFFATEDYTLKSIIVNSFPPGDIGPTLEGAFQTKAEHAKLRMVFEKKFGVNRKRPQAFIDGSPLAYLQNLITEEYHEMEEIN